ncbi:MAG: hypothetical protein CGW95_12545 [Phenylobacterium zucineum]|nr:MAG: hypothetical protein CGW95_12545 [Phenylobacterium zucineum]
MEFPKYLNVNEAADRMGVSVSYLNKLRLTEGDGPPFVKMGARVVYDPADLAAWAESQKQRSTRDPLKPSQFPDHGVRAAVVAELGEDWARSYLDPCGWDEAARVISPKIEIARRKLRELAMLELLNGLGVTVAASPAGVAA